VQEQAVAGHPLAAAPRQGVAHEPDHREFAASGGPDALPLWCHFAIRLWHATFWFDENPLLMEILNEEDRSKNLNDLRNRVRTLETELEGCEQLTDDPF
jgi:hypothetical protein